MSGSTIAFLDPDWMISTEGGVLAELSEVGSEKTYDTMNNEEFILRDMLVPFEGVMGFSLSQTRFNGTIFRLPLRMGQQLL